MGPLAGIRVIELKGLGPGPYAGMLLADLGADVVVVERASRPTGISVPADKDVTSRGKRSIALDIKNPAGLEALMHMLGRADVLFEGFRPGVAERLGVGPDEALARNPQLIYGRLTGWGQTGPLAEKAGHDINYISLSGALAAIGTADKPVPPLNLVGDYAGGSLFLVVGVLAALIEARNSGKGQVIDAAIVDGSASIMSFLHGLTHLGAWSTDRERNLLDGGAWYYGVYETADGGFMSIGPIEPQFYAEFVELAGLDAEAFGEYAERDRQPGLRQQLETVMRSKSRDEWTAVFADSDACVAPVLDLTQAPAHPHNQVRESYVEIAGVTQPAPAPRFSRSVCETPSPPSREGSDTDDVLRDYGFDRAGIDALRDAGALT